MLMKSWFGAGLLVMSLSLGGCYPRADSQDEEKNPYFVAGKDHVAARDYKGAIESFEKALEVNPKSALAHFELGVLYEQQMRDYPAAIYHYNKVIALRPKRHPSELAKQRIPSCKLEMLKDDTLATMNPVAMEEIKELRRKNQALQQENLQLRQYLEGWTAWWRRNAARVQQAQFSSPSAPRPRNDERPGVSAGRPTTYHPARAEASRSADRPAGHRRGSPRSHRVKKGETPYSLSRQYGVTVSAFMAANPGLNPRRMRVGQTVNIP